MSDTKRVFKFDEPAVGTDAEFFLVDASGMPISSEGLIGGKKAAPVLCDGGGYLEDCVTVEINPDPVPASVGAAEFSLNIRKCINEVTIVAEALDLSVDITSSHLFRPEQLVSRQASESGCSPTFDIWSNSRIRAIDISDSSHRYASGDIHLSWPLPEDRRLRVLQAKTIVKHMDVFVGLSEVAFTECTERATAGFGNAGIHRLTGYGVEYKTPSNYWLASDVRRKWVFDASIRIITTVLNDVDYYAKFLCRYGDTVQRIRRRWHSSEAESIVNDFSVLPSFPV